MESGSLLNEIAYTSAVSDSNTGLYYMNSRYYNPNTGRFLTQDSYKGNPYDPWTQHLYSYVGNNPVNMVDPTGHFASFLIRMTDGGGGSPYKPPVVNSTTDSDNYWTEMDEMRGYAGEEKTPIEILLEFAIDEGEKSQNEYNGGTPNDITDRRVETGAWSGVDTDDTMYNDYYHMTGYDWCGYFVKYCVSITGTDFVAQSSTLKYYNRTDPNLKRSSSDGYRPMSGDVFYFYGGDRSHIGLVLGSDENYMYTVEGNRGGSGMIQFCRRPYTDSDLNFVMNNEGSYMLVNLDGLDFIDPKR